MYEHVKHYTISGTNQQSSTTSATTSTSTSNAFESLPMPNSPYSMIYLLKDSINLQYKMILDFLSSDFLSTDNAQPSYPPNRTVSSDAVGPAYRQPPSSQQPSKSYPFSSNVTNETFSLLLYSNNKNDYFIF